MPTWMLLLVCVRLVEDDSADHGPCHAADDDEEADATRVLLRPGEVHHHHRVLREQALLLGDKTPHA